MFNRYKAGRRCPESSRFSLRISLAGAGAGAPSQLPGGGGLSGSMAGSIAGIRGMNAIRAFDELRSRGFENVDSLSSGNSVYGIYYYRPTRVCVQTTSDKTTVLDIRAIQNPKCH